MTPRAIHRVSMAGGKHKMVFDKVFPQVKGFTLDIRKKAVYVMGGLLLLKVDYQGLGMKIVAKLDHQTFALLHLQSMEISGPHIMWTSVLVGNVSMVTLTKNEIMPTPRRVDIPTTQKVQYFSVS